MLESPRRERQEVKFMTMNITSKQMEITPAIRQHVADRLAKLGNNQLLTLKSLRLRILF